MAGKQDAIEIFKSAVQAVQPVNLLPAHLSVNDNSLTICNETFSINLLKNVYVIGAGKAAASMAVETEKILGRYLSEGLVTTKYGHALPSSKIKIIEGAHPVPDGNSVRAVTKTMQLLQKAKKEDIIICLLSGGASALWCDVPEATTLQDVQTVFDQLLKSGASIHEMNTVRKHLSYIKGGQLIRYCGGGKVFSLIISDVPGDDTDIIASGPTVADASTFTDAYNVLSKYNLLSVLPETIYSYIENGMEGIIAETPKPGDKLFNNTVNKIIGSNVIAIQAAADKGNALGYNTYINPATITGDTETEARKLVLFIKEYSSKKPLCFLQGGETTVTVTGAGKGGRNQHFVLAALNELNEQDHDISSITILSGGTDGTDGPTDATGAIANKETLDQALQKNLSIVQYLNDHDAYNFFQQTGDLLITGPTQTNVMDIMVAIVK